MKKINYGISEDLQADIRYEPNACKGFVMDLSLGCPHQCAYCLFSPLELLVYKYKNPSFKGKVLPLRIDKFLARQQLPPAVYLCYSSDPLGNKEIMALTIQVLKKLFAHNVSVFFITKGVFDDEMLDVMRIRPDLMEIQVGVTNYDIRRNRVIEPGAASYEKRLENFEKLARIEGLGSLAARIDPLLPLIDDTADNLKRILDDISSIGVREAVIGYIILTTRMRDKLRMNSYLKESMESLTEKAETISGQELFSIPLEEKLSKLYQFEQLCNQRNVLMRVCGCKDNQLKNSTLSWICHPYNRRKREELASRENFKPTEDMLSHLS